MVRLEKGFLSFSWRRFLWSVVKWFLFLGKHLRLYFPPRMVKTFCRIEMQIAVTVQVPRNLGVTHAFLVYFETTKQHVVRFVCWAIVLFDNLTIHAFDSLSVPCTHSDWLFVQFSAQKCELLKLLLEMRTAKRFSLQKKYFLVAISDNAFEISSSRLHSLVW